jgi:serine/threonine-protein kinase HipA
MKVLMNGVRVGSWSVGSNGIDYFSYDETWLNHKDARPISLSLPLVNANHVYSGLRVSSYFENLLPDSSEIRKRIRERYKAASLSPYDLLREIGRDCVGAIQLLPEDEQLSRNDSAIEGRPIKEQEIAQILRGLSNPKLYNELVYDEFRISFAGAQEKTALLFHQDSWMVPHGSNPSTHIIKLPLGKIGTVEADMSLSMENEWLCSQIVSALGLKTALCEMNQFDDMKVLVVERFDRIYSADQSRILRIAQEDFCQITGTSPDNKYERDGGPGIETIMRLLLGSQDAQADREHFFTANIIFWLLAAFDGHAKNFSVFIGPSGRFRLTPLYDISSAYPVLGHHKNQIAPEKLRLAMSVSGKNRHYGWDGITAGHFKETANRCGLNPVGSIEKLVKTVPDALEQVASQLPNGFPLSVSDSIFAGVEKRVKLLENW